MTLLGKANWSSLFSPDGKLVIFSSNFESERGFPFDLYIIDLDGRTWNASRMGMPLMPSLFFQMMGKNYFSHPTATMEAVMILIY